MLSRRPSTPVRAAFAVIAIATLLLGATSPSLASTSSCHLSSDSHCYSIPRGTGTTFYGLYGNWNRANMTTPSSSTNPQFVDSEMWLVTSCGSSQWTETGLAYGYESRLSAVAYYAFYAWSSGSNYDLGVIATLTPNGSVTDEYQMSSPNSSGVWNVYWDGNHYTTGATNFTSGACLELGAEVASTNACAKTFTMYSSAYNSSGQRVNWGTQTGTFIPTSIAGTQLNGISYQNSEWSWNTVDSSGC